MAGNKNWTWQLRDRKGRWIDMGRGVKWYDSTRKKEVSGTVVGSDKEGTAIVELTSEPAVNGKPQRATINTNQVEAIKSKARIGVPATSPATVDRPDLNEDGLTDAEDDEVERLSGLIDRAEKAGQYDKTVRQEEQREAILQKGRKRLDGEEVAEDNEPKATTAPAEPKATTPTPSEADEDEFPEVTEEMRNSLKPEYGAKVQHGGGADFKGNYLSPEDAEKFPVGTQIFDGDLDDSGLKSDKTWTKIDENTWVDQRGDLFSDDEQTYSGDPYEVYLPGNPDNLTRPSDVKASIESKPNQEEQAPEQATTTPNVDGVVDIDDIQGGIGAHDLKSSRIKSDDLSAKSPNATPIGYGKGFIDTGITPEGRGSYRLLDKDKNLVAEVEATSSDYATAKALQEAASEVAPESYVPDKIAARSAAPQATPEAPQEAPQSPKATATPKADSNASETPSESVEEAFARLGIERTEPITLPGEKFPPTRQQQDIIDAVLAGKNTSVQALAGTGKTSTVEALAKRLAIQDPKKSIAYIAFNKSVQLEAESRKLPNLEARTGHSIAHGWSEQWMKAKTNSKDALRRADDIAGELGIRQTVRDGEGEPLSAKDQALAAMRTVDTYSNSAEDTIESKHLPENIQGNEAAEKAVLDAANKVWADLKNPEGKIRFTLDNMRKMWALSRPDLSKTGSGLKRAADLIVMDEAQDTPPVLARVMDEQKTQKLVVGDSNQNIYSSFTGSIDYMAQANSEVELPLTKSWRFGPEVAEIGNRFLQLNGAPHRVEGGGESSIVSDMQAPDAILVRSNGGMIGEILTELDNNRVVGVPNGTKKDLLSLVNSASYLITGNFPPQRMHDDLAAFKNWEEVIEEAESGNNAKVAMIAKLVAQHGPGGLKHIVNQVHEVGGKGLPGVKFNDREIGTVAEGKSYENKDVLYQAGFRLMEDPEAGRYVRGNNVGKFRKNWIATGTPEERQAKVNAATGETPVDVTISTAHKSKGLEWNRVKIGEDFRGPKINEETGEKIMPSDEEFRLGYVAVTRAQKELDPGSLSWVFDETDENGGTPNAPAQTPTPETEDLAKEGDQPVPAEPDTGTDSGPSTLEEAQEEGAPPESEPTPENIPAPTGEQDELDLGVGAKEVVDYTSENQDLIKGSDPEDEISYTDAQGDSTVYRRNNDGTWNEVVPDDDPTLEDLVVDENIPEDELMEMNKNRKLVPLNNAETDKEKEGSNEYIKNNPTAPNPVAKPTAAPAPGFNPEDSADEPWSVDDINSNIRKWPELAGAISRGNANENIDEALENDYNFIVANDDKKPFDVEFVRNEDNSSKVALKDFNTGETISEWPLTEDTDSAQVSDEIHKAINGALPQKESEVPESETGEPTGASPEPEPEPEPVAEEEPETAPTSAPETNERRHFGLTFEEFQNLPVGTKITGGGISDFIKDGDNSWKAVRKTNGEQVGSGTYEDRFVFNYESIDQNQEPQLPEDSDSTPEAPTAPEAKESEEAPEPNSAPEPAPVAVEEPEETPAPAPEPTQAPTPSAPPSNVNPIVGKAANYPDGTQLTDMKSGEMIEKTNGEWHEAGDVSRTVDPASMENLVTTDMPAQDKKSFEPFGGIDSLERGDIILTSGGSQASVVGKKDGKVVVYPHNVPDEQKALRPSIALVGTEKISGVNKFNGSGEETVPETTTAPRSTSTPSSSAPSERTSTPATERRRAPNASGSNRGRTDLELVDIRGNAVRIGDTVTSAKGDTGEVIAVRPSDGPTGSVKFRMADGSIKTVRGNKMTKRDAESETATDTVGGPDVSNMKPGEGGMAPDGRMFLVAKNGKPVFKGDRVTLSDGSVHIAEGVYVSLGSLGFKDENGKAFRKKASTVEAEDNGGGDGEGESTEPEAPTPDAAPEPEMPTVAPDTFSVPEADRFPSEILDRANKAFADMELDTFGALEEMPSKFAEPIGKFFNNDMTLAEVHELVDTLAKSARYKAMAAKTAGSGSENFYATSRALRNLKYQLDADFPLPTPDLGGEVAADSYDGSAGMRDFDFASSPFNPLSAAAENFTMPNAKASARQRSANPAITAKGVTLRDGSKVWDRNTGKFLGMVAAIMQNEQGTFAMVLSSNAQERRLQGSPARLTKEFGVLETRDPSWDTSEDMDFSNASNGAEIDTKLSEKYPGVEFNLKDGDDELSKHYGNTVSKLFNKYPSLATSVSGIGYNRFPPAVASWAAAQRSVSMNANHLDTIVTVNNTNLQNFVTNTRKNSKSGFYNNVPEGREMEYAVTHEMGHALDYRAGNLSSERLYAIISEVWGKGDASKMSPAEFRRNVKGLVSDYSLHKDGSIFDKELVAESFADVEINGTNAKPISKAVHYALMNELKNVGGAGTAELIPESGDSLPFDSASKEASNFGLENVFPEGGTFGDFISGKLSSSGNLDSGQKASLEKAFQTLGERISKRVGDGLEVTLYEEITWGYNAVSASWEFKKDGEVVGSMTRSFLMEEPLDNEEYYPTVYSDKFVLDPSYRGKGVGSAVLEESDKLYKEMGMKYNTLKANIDVGGYAWARAGFNFQSLGSLRLIIGNIEQMAKNNSWDFLDSLRFMSGKPAIPPTDAELAEFRALQQRATKANFEAGTAPTPFEISQIGAGAGGTNFGKRILLGSTWEGIKPIA